MANDYATLEDVQELLSDTNLGVGYDSLIEGLITRASRLIDRLTNRGEGAYAASTDETRYFDGSGGSELWIEELAAAPTSVSVAETGDVDGAAGTGGTYTLWSTSDYLLWPYNALLRGEPYVRLDIDLLNGSKGMWYGFRKGVKVVGKFGWSTAAPEDVKQGTLITAVRWFKRAQQAFQDTGAILELGQLRYVKALDPDVEEMVRHLRRQAI